jgi:chromosome segregation ATPase
MENNDVKALIEAFRAYRDLLFPLQEGLHDFAQTYDSLRSDIDKLNASFGGDLQGNLDKIYKNLSRQAENAADLSSRIDQFVKVTNKYTADFSKLLSTLEKIEERLNAVNELESKAEEQIGKLDAILEEKKRSYNIRELQKTLDTYNANVQKVSEFINKDVAESLSQNYKKLEDIRNGNETLSRLIEGENGKIEAMLETCKSTGELLRRAVEKEDLNEDYIFDILDKWAERRKVLRLKK